MKKTVLIIAACLFMGKAAAQDTAGKQPSGQEEPIDAQLCQTFLDNVYVNDFWGANWFLSVKGGISAFVGKPVGHGDFFDREKEMLNVAVGKWFTPKVAGRIAFQGLKLMDTNLQPHAYKNLHVDLMYNLTGHTKFYKEDMPRWDVMPYAGCGVLTNSADAKDRKFFAISFGLVTRYRLGKRINLSAEIGNTLTWQNYDGQGRANALGDNLLQGSIGLDVTIGKAGWKRVVDPQPYIMQNDVLLERIKQIKAENDKLNKTHMKDAMSLAEMRKILEIEGLLDKYNLADPSATEAKAYPKNNYSGLNSLRERLRSKAGFGEEKIYPPLTEEQKNLAYTGDDDEGASTPEEYFRVMRDGKIFVGSPIYFFFKLAKDELTEQAQIINIREVASTIKKYGLYARVVGAADSQTGTAYLNEQLSLKRAEFMANLLKENGVPEDRITVQFRGGINTYMPLEGNRNTCIMLYFKEK